MTQAQENIETWFIHLGAHDPEMTLRLMLIRLMVEHREIGLQELAKTIGSSREWVSMALLGKAYYESGPPETWKKNDKAHAFLDKIEQGITAITDSRGGLCCATSRADMTALLATPEHSREQFRGRLDRT